MRAPLAYRLMTGAVAIAACAAFGANAVAAMTADVWRERREARRGRVRAQRAPAWEAPADDPLTDPLADPLLRRLGALARERREAA